MGEAHRAALTRSLGRLTEVMVRADGEGEVGARWREESLIARSPTWREVAALAWRESHARLLAFGRARAVAEHLLVSCNAGDFDCAQAELRVGCLE